MRDCGSEYRFDGRVAVITGAGGNPGLGRAHAMLLARRGASIVVNDIAGSPDAPGYIEHASVDAVVAEILDAGGKAVACNASVAEEGGAAAIIEAALEAFGRLDILVNNAGISITAPFDQMTARDFRQHIEVNLLGTYYCCHAAWPYMKAQGYGRIVNTTSASMTGYVDQAAYGASKGGVWSLTRALAAEGAALGIKVNAFSPGAFSRMVSAMMDEESPMLRHARAELPAELASPALAWLCHEDCPTTGECIDSAGGAVQRTYIAQTPGVATQSLTVEDVAAGWDAILDARDAQAVGLGTHDTTAWKIKPYNPERLHV